MLNLLQAQKDMLMLLLCSAQLNKINFKLQRQMQLESEVDMSIIWTTPRNGCAGIGGIVEMPTAACDEKQTPGPILNWVFSIHILEVPLLNFAQQTANRPAKGSFIPAEDVVQMVLDEVHRYADERLASFTPLSNPVQPANLASIALGYRVSFLLNKARTVQTNRTGQVKTMLGTGTIAFACALDSTAPIYYTTNGSFPANDPAINPTTQLYDGNPVAVESGQEIRARAYAEGKLGGATTYNLIA